jgi:hypothetical protein
MLDEHRVTDEELRRQIGTRLLEGRLPSVNGVSSPIEGPAVPASCAAVRSGRPRSSAKSEGSGCPCSPTRPATSSGARSRWRAVQRWTAKSREEDGRLRASHLRDLQATDPAEEWPVSNRLGRRPRNILRYSQTPQASVPTAAQRSAQV